MINSNVSIIIIFKIFLTILQELDKLKVPFSREKKNVNINLSSRAISAIEFISNILDETSKKAGLFSTIMKSNFLFESAALSKEPSNMLIKCDLNDDRIINYSLQLKNNFQDSLTVLVTNDRNLINKSLINKLQSLNFNNFVVKLEHLVQNQLSKTSQCQATTSKQEITKINIFSNDSTNPSLFLIRNFLEKIVIFGLLSF
jgi:predicted ribonuclease YlaK